jgi:hypothetical protein
VRSRGNELLRRTGAFLTVTVEASPGFLDIFRVVKTVFLECCYFTPFSVKTPDSNPLMQ